MHSRKTLQKKETSAPIPKKYLEYAVSQGGVVRGSTLIETAHPGQPRGRAVLLGSLTLLLSNQVPFPNKISCFVSTCVSSDNSFPSVRQEPSFGPWKGSPFLQQTNCQKSKHSNTNCNKMRYACFKLKKNTQHKSCELTFIQRLYRELLPRRQPVSNSEGTAPKTYGRSHYIYDLGGLGNKYMLTNIFRVKDDC